MPGPTLDSFLLSRTQGRTEDFSGDVDDPQPRHHCCVVVVVRFAAGRQQKPAPPSPRLHSWTHLRPQLRPHLRHDPAGRRAKPWRHADVQGEAGHRETGEYTEERREARTESDSKRRRQNGRRFFILDLSPLTANKQNDSSPSSASISSRPASPSPPRTTSRPSRPSLSTSGPTSTRRATCPSSAACPALGRGTSRWLGTP